MLSLELFQVQQLPGAEQRQLVHHHDAVSIQRDPFLVRAAQERRQREPGPFWNAGAGEVAGLAPRQCGCIDLPAIVAPSVR